MFETFLPTLLPVFSHFILGVILTAGFVSAYTVATPWNDMALIQQGKLAPALALLGAVVGFSLPLGAVFALKMGLTNILFWAVVILFVNLMTFYVIHFLGGKMANRIATENCLTSGMIMGGGNLVVGIILFSSFLP